MVKYHLNILEIFQETDDIFSYSIFSLFIVTLALLCIEVYRASMVILLLLYFGAKIVFSFLFQI